MRPYSQEIREQAKRLWGQGLSQREIGRRLNIPDTTIGYWLHPAIVERRKKSANKWATDNRVKVATISRNWRVANPELVAEKRRKWRAANPEYGRARVSLRSARKRGTEIDPWMQTPAGIRAVVDLQLKVKTCCYCSLNLGAYHIDHRTPVVRGGRHELSNLGICCPACNFLKGNRTESEYREYMATVMLDRIMRVTGGAV